MSVLERHLETHSQANNGKYKVYQKVNGSANSRMATFRHIFTQPTQRVEWLNWGAGHGSNVIANPKFVAVALEGGAGGQILVGLQEAYGKRNHLGLARLQDHKDYVTDIKWNHFNDNVLASCSADCSIKIWHVTDELKAQCVRTLERHSRRVEQVEWHTTVDNVVLSAGSDCRILLWDVEVDAVICEVSDFSASCIAFSPNSSLFAATSRQYHRVCIFDARTGNAMKSVNLPHDGGMAPKVIFISAQRLITFGNTRINRRQFAIYSTLSLNSPLATIDIDGSSGQLCPIFDYDLNILYVSGKGDLTFRLYELINNSPYVIYLTECQQTSPHTCVCTISKRALNLTEAEVMRIYRLHPESLLIQPISFIVPRKTGHFHPELYPPTRGPTPASSLAEWRAGLDVMPVLLHLRPGQLYTTSKPVRVRGKSSSPKLITSDRNNDMKFRFLSKMMTRPDYRSVTEREDCEEITKLVTVKQKVQNERMISLDSEPEKKSAAEYPAVIPLQSPVQSQKNNGSVSKESNNTTNNEQLFDQQRRPIDEPISDDSNPFKQYYQTNEIRDDLEGKESCLCGDVSVASTSTCQAIRNAAAEDVGAPDTDIPKSSGSLKNNGFSCDSIRSSDVGYRLLENTIAMLEQQLRRSDNRILELERLCEIQQKDVESLRYEISWKDDRIEYLQRTLAEMEDMLSKSSH